ncbi:UNVERIFIED_CONTAM: putative WRKY transcription factor 41 [Sesamum angustifolium]|uniref:WRKY transcription factor 41 n=1 Tax=Sesamum angustifolium TaxID=2727405 RepID=A0AAW2RGP0_9LAMI
MEKLASLDRTSVISVLTQGKELANELKKLLHPTTTSKEACDSLLENILSSYENALRLLNCMGLLGNGGDPSQFGVSNFSGSPYSIEGSPRSEVSEHNSKDHQPHKVVSKKRKTLPRWSEKMRVCPETGSEGQLDDGYNWRKYGQKDILGANHPRAYYRCTHRNTQGCLATKQVQRADEDPSIFEVIYSGKQLHSRETKTEERKCHRTKQRRREPKTCTTGVDATSESYFSLSPCPVNDPGIVPSLQSSESDFAEIISNPTPAMSFPFEDLDSYLIDQVDFQFSFRSLLAISHVSDSHKCEKRQYIDGYLPANDPSQHQRASKIVHTNIE